MSVGEFNARSFATVNTDEKTMLDFVRANARVRPGFKEFIEYCRDRGIQFNITSNGLDFYIRFILRDLGLDNVPVFAAETKFGTQGVEVKYIGPSGDELMKAFKESFTLKFVSEGYRVIYIGNGMSDFPAAKMCHHIFAREDLLANCLSNNVNHTPFNDFREVVTGLESLNIR